MEKQPNKGREQKKSPLDELREQIAARNAEWTRQWPKHCNKCGGWGVFTYEQGHPYGMTTAYETMTDPCDCTADGRCARCGKADALGEECDGPCKFCGWNYDDGVHEL